MKIKVFLCTLCTAIFCMSALCVPAFADLTASSYISVSESTASIGDQITVTVNVVGESANVGCVDGTLSYHSDVVEFVSAENANGSSGTVRISAYDASNTEKNMLITMTFRAIGTGSTYFSFSSNEVTDVEENPMSCNDSSELLTVVSEDLSDNADLSAIRISSGSLSPSFSADTTSYEVNVGHSVEEVVLSATAYESDATVSVSGEDYISVGENTRIITVTAPDGETTKKYTVTIYRSAVSQTSDQVSSESDSSDETSSTDTSFANANSLSVRIGSKNYTIIQKIEPDVIPKGFALSTQYYDNIECEVAYHKAGDVTLFYMEDESKNRAFYVYNSESNEFYDYLILDSKKLSLTILDKPTSVEIPKNFVESVLYVNDISYKAWKLEHNEYKGYYLVYGMTANGETDLYMYDSNQGTLQKYLSISQTVEVHDKADQSNSLYLIIAIISLAVICIVLFIIIVVLCMKHREYKF